MSHRLYKGYYIYYRKGIFYILVRNKNKKKCDHCHQSRDLCDSRIQLSVQRCSFYANKCSKGGSVQCAGPAFLRVTALLCDLPLWPVLLRACHKPCSFSYPRMMPSDTNPGMLFLCLKLSGGFLLSTLKMVVLSSMPEPGRDEEGLWRL